jgi:autotransporter-associated beta strand protein
VNTLNLSGTGASLTLGSGETLSINGILRSGAATSGVISGGTGIQTVSGGGELVIRTNLAADLLTLATPILDNGVSSLTKSGAGTLLLSGANTYAGETFLNGGTLRITNANSLGANTDVNVTGSSRISASGGITYANAITVNSGRTLDLLNPATGSASTAEFTGVLSGTGNLFLPNSGGNGIEGIFAFTNDLNTFTGNVVLSVSGAGNEHFKFASIGDGGNFTFAKNGNRQLITYTGASPITFDTRQIVVATTMSNGGATDRQGMDGNGSNGVSIFANDATDIGSTVTFNTDMVVNNIASTYGVLYFGGTNAGDNTFAGAISDTSGASKLCIGKFGAGKWILSGSNTYEGNTLISNGTLSVNTIANAATPQPLGIGPAIQLGVGNSGNTGTLSYTGGIASTDKQVVIGSPANTVNQAAVGSFLNNGSGPLTFTNPTFNPTSTSYIQPGTSTSLPGFVTATRTLTLGGTYADGTNEIQGVIQNNSSVSGTGAGIVGLTVSASNWKLSGTNTYTGLTTVNGGTLQLGNGGALGFGGLQRSVATSGTTVSGGGSLDLNGTTAISEPITLNTSSSTALVNSNTSAAASIGSGIAGITLGTAGSGYSAPPTVTINGTGTGATAVASLGLTAATFGTPTLTGTRTGTPTVVISGGGGTGAVATCTTAGVLTITQPGTGYTSAPTITVTVTGGTIVFTPNANNFTVSAVQMTNAGSGYTGTPTYTFDSGSATAGVVSRSSVILSANSSIGGAGDMTIDAVVSQSGGAPGLTKVGAGTLTLTAANTYTGNTNVSEGALILADNAQLSFVLGASGINNSITGAGTVTLDGDFNINTTAADGLSSGSWTLENVDTLAGAYGSSFTVTGFTDIGGDKWEKTVGSKIYTFDETTGILTLVTPDPFPAWAASKGLTGAPGFENGKGDDPDGDGFTNLDEFAFDGNPLSGANDGKIVGKIATVGPDQVMTLTLPVRNGATFANDGGDQLSALIDGVYYRVEGSLDLSVFANTVTEVTPTITAGLPALSSGWTYRSFRAPGTVPTVSRTFLRVKASETP